MLIGVTLLVLLSNAFELTGLLDDLHVPLPGCLDLRLSLLLLGFGAKQAFGECLSQIIPVVVLEIVLVSVKFNVVKVRTRSSVLNRLVHLSLTELELPFLLVTRRASHFSPVLL